MTVELLIQTNERTIVSAMKPRRFRDDLTMVFLTVWFEELSQPVPFAANVFDCEPHGRKLWFRAMRGDYGPIEVIDKDFADREEPLRLALL